MSQANKFALRLAIVDPYIHINGTTRTNLLSVGISGNKEYTQFMRFLHKFATSLQSFYL